MATQWIVAIQNKKWQGKLNMTNVYKQAENEKFVLKIEYDECAESPREWDNLGTIVGYHSRYSLTDSNANDCNDYREFLESNTSHHFNTDEGLENATDERLMELFAKENIVLPIYMYEHSGVALNTSGFSCGWDSGQVGFIYVSKEDVRKEWGVKRISSKLKEKIIGNLEAEVSLYSDYINGDIYGFILEEKIKQEDGTIELEHVDSCWGFIGRDTMIEDMKWNVSAEAMPLFDELEYAG